MENSKVLLIVVNVDWIFISHRLPIALEAQKKGYKVVVAANDSGKANEIRKQGIEFHNLPISRAGKNPLEEFKTILALRKLYKKIKPSIVHHITMKPVIYGSLVVKSLGNRIGVLNAISGLGYSFTGEKKNGFQYIMIFLMRLAFKNKRILLLFQNKDDFEELKSLKIISKKNKVKFIKGVGVDLNEYKPKSRQANKKVLVVFPARMLFDKGVLEFMKAALLLKTEYSTKAKFLLCGMIDHGNPTCIEKEQLEKYLSDDYLVWKGHQKNMLSVYQKSDIVVLPSYREGLPKSLIEACAVGIPIVTTTAIGCKDCVDQGKNGYKVPVKSVKDLAKAIQKLIDSPTKRINMGAKSREKAKREFDRILVIEEHLKIYEELSQS